MNRKDFTQYLVDVKKHFDTEIDLIERSKLLTYKQKVKLANLMLKHPISEIAANLNLDVRPILKKFGEGVEK